MPDGPTPVQSCDDPSRRVAPYHFGFFGALLIALGLFSSVPCWSCTRGHDEHRSNRDSRGNPTQPRLGVITPEPATSQPPASAASAAGAATPVEPGELGFGSVPLLPSPEAVTENHRGFAEYKRKRIEIALSYFEQAVAKAPDFDLARYNATAMLALLGRHAECAKSLSSLLKRDLPRFYPRLLADPDFETFRASEAGRSSVRQAESLREVWLGLAKTGVPMTAYVSHRLGTTDGMPEVAHQRPEWFRVGVWLPSAQRFLALLPPLPHALGALLDPALGRGLVVDGEISLCRADFCPRLDHVRIFDFDRFVPAATPKTSIDVEGEGSMLFEVRVELTERGPRWLANDRASEVWQEAIDGRAERSKIQAASEWLGLHVGMLGGYFVHLPKGWRRVKNYLVLPDGRRVKLTWRDASAALELVEVPGRNQAILVAVRAGCDCLERETSILDYTVQVLDLLHLTLTLWDKGQGMAAAYADSDRGIYLQRNQRLERFGAAGVERPAQQLPNGMLLCPPMIPDGNCCGL
jgi:tetratricopeptide (TPR) repeat protein